MSKQCDCGRYLQGTDKTQLASGKCELCFEQTPEGRKHYEEVAKAASRKLGPNWRSVILGHGDQ